MTARDRRRGPLWTADRRGRPPGRSRPTQPSWRCRRPPPGSVYPIAFPDRVSRELLVDGHVRTQTTIVRSLFVGDRGRPALSFLAPASSPARRAAGSPPPRSPRPDSSLRPRRPPDPAADPRGAARRVEGASTEGAAPARAAHRPCHGTPWRRSCSSPSASNSSTGGALGEGHRRPPARLRAVRRPGARSSDVPGRRPGARAGHRDDHARRLPGRPPPPPGHGRAAARTTRTRFPTR